MSNTKAVSRHPSIYSYPTKRGLRYAAVATVEGRQRWSRGHRTITAAETETIFKEFSLDGVQSAAT